MTKDTVAKWAGIERADARLVLSKSAKLERAEFLAHMNEVSEAGRIAALDPGAGGDVWGNGGGKIRPCPMFIEPNSETAAGPATVAEMNKVPAFRYLGTPIPRNTGTFASVRMTAGPAMSVVEFPTYKGRNSAQWEQRAAKRFRDSGNGAAALAAGLGISPANLRRLQEMDYEVAAAQLAAWRVAGKLESEPRHAVSADWEAVAAWQVAAPTAASKRTRYNRRKVAGKPRVEWIRPDGFSNVHGNRLVSIPATLDGPGTKAMISMGQPAAMAWAIRGAKSSPVAPALGARTKPVAVNVSPKVIADGKWASRYGIARELSSGITFGPDGSYGETLDDGSTLIGLPGIGYGTAWSYVGQTVTPESERPKAVAPKETANRKGPKVSIPAGKRISYKDKLAAARAAKLAIAAKTVAANEVAAIS